MTPWYRGYEGTILSPGEEGEAEGDDTGDDDDCNIQEEDGIKEDKVSSPSRSVRRSSFVSKGVIERVKGGVRVLELPVRRWTGDFKAHLESLASQKKGIVKDYTQNHTDVVVDFRVELSRHGQTLSDRELFRLLRLQRSMSLNNIHAFDPSGAMAHYSDPLQIMEEFITVRKQLYEKRHAHMVSELGLQVRRLDNRRRFVEMVSEGKLKVMGRSKRELEEDIRRHNFMEDEKKESGAYDYLLNLPIYDLTQENILKLRQHSESATKSLQILESKSPTDLWLEDLAILQSALKKVL